MSTWEPSGAGVVRVCLEARRIKVTQFCELLEALAPFLDLESCEVRLSGGLFMVLDTRAGDGGDG